MELIKYYNQNKEYIKTLERGHPSAKELWCNIVVGLIVNLRTKKLYLQVDTNNNLQLTGGGHVKHDEKIEDSINREMLEETGIKTSDCKLLDTFYYTCTPKKQYHNYFIYNADVVLDSFQTNDKEEISTFIEIEIDELLNQSGCIGKDVESVDKILRYDQIVSAFNGKYVLQQICDVIRNAFKNN